MSFFFGQGMGLQSGQTCSILDSIVVSIPACHAGDQGSIPCRGASFFEKYFSHLKTWCQVFHCIRSGRLAQSVRASC